MYRYTLLGNVSSVGTNKAPINKASVDLGAASRFGVNKAVAADSAAPSATQPVVVHSHLTLDGREVATSVNHINSHNSYRDGDY